MPRLEDWNYITNVDDAYLAPECMCMVIGGAVYEHHTFGDGERITTSEIVHVFLGDNGNFVARTFSGSVYELGKPGTWNDGKLIADFEKLRDKRARANNPFPGS